MREILHRLSTSCLLCGGFTLSRERVCSYCENQLLQRKSQKLKNYSVVSGLKVRRVWEWNSTNDNLLRRLVYSLKNGRAPRALYKWLAIQMVGSCLPGSFKQQQNIVVVPSPPGRLGQKDHAFYLAEAVSELLDCKLRPCLVRHFLEVEQKHLGREKRLTRQMNFIGDDRRRRGSWVIFVDDIVTTGGTAVAAQKSLKNPEKFEVWTLATRSFLRVSSDTAITHHAVF